MMWRKKPLSLLFVGNPVMDLAGFLFYTYSNIMYFCKNQNKITSLCH